MFLISTKLFFVVSVMLVESYYVGVKIGVPFIADKFRANKRTLSTVFNRLMRAGILRSQTGGADAGFIFTRDPKSITVADIVIALEGEEKMESFRELCPETICLQESCEGCILNEVVNSAIKARYSKLASVSLYDLYASSKKNSQEE